MIRLASGLASRVRSANSSFCPILSWRRSNAAEYIEPCVDKVLWHKIGRQLGWSRSYAQHIVKFTKPYDDCYPWPEVIKLEEESPSSCCATPSLLLQVEHLKYVKTKVGTDYHDMLSSPLCSGLKKELEAGVDVHELQTGIDMAYEVVKEHLKQRARMVKSFEEISQIATIAANKNGKVGGLVAKAMEKLGKEDFFMIFEDLFREGKRKINKMELLNAMKLKWGCFSPYFYEFRPQQTCVMEYPLILIHENKILNKNFVKQAVGLGEQPLLIVAEDVDLEVAGSIMLDRTCLENKVCIVQAPNFQENRKEIMEDLAILTGGQVVTERSNISSIPLMLGSCKEVRVSSDETIFLGGFGIQADIEKRREQLRSKIKLSASDFEVNMLKDRCANLSRNLAVFEVDGGNKYYKKKKVVDALNVVKHAMEEGIIPGCGVALLHASKEMDKLQTSTSGSKIGAQLFQNALKMPVYTFACAAGFDGSVAVEKIWKLENTDLGYDVVSGEYVDMMKSGNFDMLQLVLSDLYYIKCTVEALFELHRQHKGKLDGIC